MLMYQYRKLFYEKYFESQAGRRLPQDQLKNNLEREIKLFQKEILPHVYSAKDSVVLDIGCGFGSLVETFKRSGFSNAQGIDISPDMVQTAAQLGIHGVKEADILPYLKAHPGAFDIITGMDIIEHFSKDELVELLHLVRHALKPGGRAIFRTPNTDAAFYTLYSYGDFTHENYMNASSAKQVMMNCGFPEVQVYASHLQAPGFVKEFFRKISWQLCLAFYKWQLFASGRSSSDVVFTPNMVIVCTNS